MGNMLACLAEGLALSKDADLPQEALLEILSQGAMANPMFALKGPVSKAHLAFIGTVVSWILVKLLTDLQFKVVFNASFSFSLSTDGDITPLFMAQKMIKGEHPPNFPLKVNTFIYTTLARFRGLHFTCSTPLPTACI
jgi:hypothetical protein